MKKQYIRPVCFVIRNSMPQILSASGPQTEFGDAKQRVGLYGDELETEGEGWPRSWDEVQTESSENATPEW